MILSASARYVAAFVFLSAGAVCSLQAQTGGALTPDGAPGRTMKSLDQMEPRTPLIEGAAGVALMEDGAWEITESGSYYLVGNVTATVSDGIRLKADNITLDLRGFTLTSETRPFGGDGILIEGNDIRIFNGHIVSKIFYNPEAEGWVAGGGFDCGIRDGATATNLHIRDVSVRGCFSGIVCNLSEFGASSLIESCTAHTIAGSGIVGVNVTNCVARMCGQSGIRAEHVSNSVGHSIQGHGIFADYTVSNCQGESGGSDSDARGIHGGNISDSHGVAKAGSGILALGNVINCSGVTQGTSFDAHGIEASGNVFNSSGRTQGGRGIEARIVGYCEGYTNGTSDNSDGIFASYNASYSFGRSDNVSGGDGVRTTIASFCTGTSDGSQDDDVGVRATLAVGCITSGGEAIGDKHLMP